MKHLIIHIVSITILLLGSISTNAADTASYQKLEEKASLFYGHKEWASAMAMYELMLQQKPDNTDLYSRLIVLAGVTKHTELQSTYLERSEVAAVPLDSIFTGVRTLSISLVRPDIYIDFMEFIKTRQPWLTRSINIRLLDFYKFRGNSKKTIEMALDLLDATPDNTLFLSAVAEAYTQQGQYKEAMDWYKKIIGINPNDYDALLILGNYYKLQVDSDLKSIGIDTSTSAKQKSKLIKWHNKKETILNNTALSLYYLNKACSIYATPYIKSTIKSLNAILALTK